MRLILLASEAQRITLGDDGGARARCQQCEAATGTTALAHFRLRGLYCSEHCIRLAAHKPALWVSEPYAHLLSSMVESV